jgi:hypothetical protein
MTDDLEQPDQGIAEDEPEPATEPAPDPDALPEPTEPQADDGPKNDPVSDGS